MATKEELDGSHDTIGLKIDGYDIKIAESYEVKISILQQPSAFALRMGSNKTAADLLSIASPGSTFELSVITGGTPRVVQSGIIDSCGVPSAGFTQVEVKGRDYLSVLFDSFVDEEQDFPQDNFLKLTRKVLDLVGLTEARGHRLHSINDTNRKLLTGVNVQTRNSVELAEELHTGSLAGTGDLVYKTMKAKLGTRYYDFLQQQYKLAGLFLWASPDKTFVLARPRADQDASYNLYRGRPGNSAQATNILDCRFHNDTSMRHTSVTVYGRSGGGKNGAVICQGVFPDDEMYNNYTLVNGYNKNLVVHDQDVKDQAECEYVARRMICEERRAGWQLEYTVAGHQVPSSKSATGVAIWGPDTVIRVDDEEIHNGSNPSLNFKKNFYLEAVTYSSNPQKTTKLTLMRPEDLLFAHGLQDDGSVIKRNNNSGKGKTIK